jgi:TonB-linked SusC/RagA family outer membrane protein
MIRQRVLKGVCTMGAAVVLLLAGAMPGQAQATGTIQGTVTGRMGVLPGIEIQVVGTALFGVTGANGLYQIRSVPAGPRAIRATSIGYSRVDTIGNVVPNQTLTLDFTMVRTVIALDEVVVTGTAGGTSKIRLGNSVGTISTESLDLAPIHNVVEMLTARTPGLTLMSTSGQVGSSSNIRIRGAGSLNGGYAPVFYVDGVRIEAGRFESGSTNQGGTSLDFLNPDDIESIEFLKGPSAATLYGADAANGVIQIITKKGRRGAESVQWTASAEVGQSEWDEGLYDYTNYWRCTESNQGSSSYPGCSNPGTVEWWGKDNNGDAVLNVGIPDSDITPIYVDGVADGTFLLRDNALFRDPNAIRKGNMTNFNVSARGGTGRAGYFISFNKGREEGVFYNNFSERMGGRANFDANVSETLDLSTSFSYTRTHLQQPLNNNASNSINRNGMRGRARAYSDPWAPGFRGFSPALSNEYDSQNKLERMTIGLTANWIPFEWFRNRVTLGLDKQNYVHTTFYKQDTTGRAPWGTTTATGTISQELPSIHRWTVDYSGSADYDINQDFGTVTSVGAQLNSRTRHSITASGQGLVANSLNLVSAAALRNGSESLSEQVSLGFFVQEQIGWKDRLYGTIALRVDDNSAFGSEFSLVYYPKASIAWNVSEEDFFNFDFADDVKLRFAWGKAGNAPAPFSADRTWSPGQYVEGDALVNQVSVASYGNPDLKAETGQEFEVGFDASLWNGRLGVEFSYYNQRTKDALISVPDPGSTGFTGNHMMNIGEIANSGIELMLTGMVMERDKFMWDAYVTIATNNNELVSFNGARDETVFGSFADVQRHREGYPMGAFWAVDVDRDATGEAILDSGGGVTVANSCRWAPSDPDWNQAAECEDIYMGPSRPTFEASLGSTWTIFSDLRLSAQLDYRAGHYQWCAICSINSRSDRNTWDINTGGTDLNPNVSETDILVLRSRQTLSHISPADFIKFRELSLTYSLPQRYSQNIPGGAQYDLTVSGRNLWMWTKYEGKGDPEVMFSPNSSFTMLDYASTPQTRRLSASLRVRF